MSTAKHTAGPWSHDETWGLIKGPQGEEVAAIHSGQGDGERVNRHIAQANAAFIVRACNSHDELLAACKIALQQLEGAKSKSGVHASSLAADIRIVREAITKAEAVAKKNSPTW